MINTNFEIFLHKLDRKDRSLLSDIFVNEIINNTLLLSEYEPLDIELEFQKVYHFSQKDRVKLYEFIMAYRIINDPPDVEEYKFKYSDIVK